MITTLSISTSPTKELNWSQSIFLTQDVTTSQVYQDQEMQYLSRIQSSTQDPEKAFQILEELHKWRCSKLDWKRNAGDIFNSLEQICKFCVKNLSLFSKNSRKETISGAFGYWKEYVNYVSQPDIVIFYLYDLGIFNQLPGYFLFACEIMTGLREFILASMFLDEAESIPNLDEDSEHQIHQKWQYLETKVIQLKRRYFPSSNLINNYDSDAGISQKYFEILEELNLEQKTNKVITKLDHPFGLDPASQTKLLNLEHSQPPLQTAQSQILPRKAQNSHFLSNTSCRKIKRTHTFKLRTKNRQVKRFSDLVNKTASKIYLTRPKRQEYHGRIALLAKELEYLSLQIQGKRLVNHKKFNKRRPMVIGNFWVIQAKREKALNEIMGGRRRRSIKRSKRKTGKSIDFETMRLEYNKSLESVRERGKRRTSSSKPSHFNFTPKTPEPEEVLGKGSELVLKVLSSSKKVLGTGGPLSNLYETPNKTSRTGFIKFGSSKNKSGMGPGSSSSSSRREALCKKIEKRQKRRLDVVFDYYSESSQKRQLEADRMVEEHCVDEFNTRSTMDSLLLIGKSRKKPKVEIGDVISPIRERPSRMIGAMRRKTDGEFASSPFDFDA